MALPTWVKPQLTKLVDQPPDGPDGSMKSSSTAIACTQGWTGARCGC